MHALITNRKYIFQKLNIKKQRQRIGRLILEMVRSRGNRGRGRAGQGQGQGRGRVWRGRGSRRGRVVTNRQPNLRENSREDDTFVWNGEDDLYFFN